MENPKLEKLKVLISPDTASDNLLLYLLEQAEGIVLNRRYPFGVPEGAELSVFHQQVQKEREKSKQIGTSNCTPSRQMI